MSRMVVLARWSSLLGRRAPSLLLAIGLIGALASIQGIAEAQYPVATTPVVSDSVVPDPGLTQTNYFEEQTAQEFDPRQTQSYSRGRSLYLGKCARCHALYSPSSFSAGEWPGIVRSMKADAGLNEGEITAISAYLSAEAEQGGGHGRGPRVGGYLYTEYFLEQPNETKGFDIHYLALSFSGWANEQIYYYAEFELEHGGTTVAADAPNDSGSTNTFVEQAYIDYWFFENVAIKVGAMLTPFNRFDDFHGPLTNFTISRPIMARELGVSAFKDVGVDLHGVCDVTSNSTLIWDAYMINGMGNGSRLRTSRQYRDNNDDLAFGGRWRLLFYDDYELGMSGYQGAWDDDDLYDVKMIGTHFMAHTAFADFYAEATWAESENPAGTADGNMDGWFIQATRPTCNQRLRYTVRYGELDYLDPGTQLGRSATDKDVGELALCLGYYPTPNVVFKLEYRFVMEGLRKKPSTKNDVLGFQAAVQF